MRCCTACERSCSTSRRCTVRPPTAVCGRVDLGLEAQICVGLRCTERDACSGFFEWHPEEEAEMAGEPAVKAPGS